MDLLGIGASSVQPVLLGNSHVSGRLHPSLQPNDVSAFGALASPNGRQIVEAGIAMQNAGKAALSSIQRSELQLARTRAEKATAGRRAPPKRYKSEGQLLAGPNGPAPHHNLRSGAIAATGAAAEPLPEDSDDGGGGDESDGDLALPMGMMTQEEVDRYVAAKIAGGASDKDARRLRRLLRNRVSAQQARERKKQYVTTLEDQVKTQASTIAGLEKRVDELTVQNTALRNLIQTMRSPAKRLSGAGAFDASSLPRPDAQRLAAVAAAAAGRAPPRRSMSGGSAQLRPEPQAANTGAGQRASPHHHSLSPNALQSQLQPAGKCMLPPDSQLHGGMGSGTYVAGQAIAAAPAGPYDVEDVAEAHAEMDPDGLYRSEPAVDASSGFGTAEGDMHAAIVDYHAHAHQLSEQALQPSEHVQQLASMRTRVQAAQHLDQANAATQDHALPDGFAHEQQHYAQLQQCSVVIAQLPPNYSRYNQQYSMQYNSGQYSNVGSTMDAAMVPSNQVANGHGYGCYMESYADMNGMQGVPHSAAMNGTLHVLDGDMGDAAVVPAL